MLAYGLFARHAPDQVAAEPAFSRRQIHRVPTGADRTVNKVKDNAFPNVVAEPPPDAFFKDFENGLFGMN